MLSNLTLLLLYSLLSLTTAHPSDPNRIRPPEVIMSTLQTSSVAPASPAEPSSVVTAIAIASTSTLPPSPLPPPPPPAHEKPLPPMTSKNCKGSSMCRTIRKEACWRAYSQYVDDWVYLERTSVVAKEQPGTFGGLFGGGCTAIFVCENDEDYKRMQATGWQIKQMFEQLYNDLDSATDEDEACKICGSYYVEGGCHVTANYCSHCSFSGKGAPEGGLLIGR
ncbi:MAG: hypothetical protein M1817_000478 [Caeruleum heppii]|nr:MAG: hypothetical protein M1817_000478 [Caeruleum heppii]